MRFKGRQFLSSCTLNQREGNLIKCSQSRRLENNPSFSRSPWNRTRVNLALRLQSLILYVSRPLIHWRSFATIVLNKEHFYLLPPYKKIGKRVQWNSSLIWSLQHEVQNVWRTSTSIAWISLLLNQSWRPLGKSHIRQQQHQVNQQKTSFVFQ